MFTTGTRFGPYEIVERLAEGGMGEVYKALDTRLDRVVALKVLPTHLSADPELRRRFEREARAISALSHPNICTLYDVGNEGGQEYLVMEFLDGQTLAGRLQQGPLSLDEVLRFGSDIARALEKAHRQGIVHRDLKPANVVLTRTGAKLLDFGLAKWLPNETLARLGRVDEATAPLTSHGMLIGTIPYMSPEQLEGREADPRSDIFSFGAILYEMATGQRPFDATSNASIIAAILREQPPPPSRIRPLAPQTLDRIVATCLAKHPDERFQSAQDVRIALELLVAGGDPAPAEEPRSRKPWLVPVVAAVVATAAMFAAAAAVWMRPSDTSRAVRFTIAAPLGSAFPSLGEGGGLALSPDGRQLVFEATTPDGRTYLWLRGLDAEVPEMLEGSEGGEYPFWSPDGRAIAFFADGKLKRMNLPGGPAQTICDAPSGRGGAWSSRGLIIFAPESSGPLFRVPAGGGVPQRLTNVAADVYSHRWPLFIDEERYLFVSQSQRPSARGVFAGSLEEEETHRVLPVALSAAFAPPHHLYYVRDDLLVRQQLDLDKLEVTGEAVTIADAMICYTDRAYAPATAAGTTVAYRRNGASNMRIAWFGRDGRRLTALNELGEYEGVSLSPDGSRIAFGYFDVKESLNHIAISSPGGVPRRFTFARGNQYSPVWSPDGKQIAFSDDHAGVDTISVKPVAGTSRENALIPKPASSTYVQSWSPDGRHLLFRWQHPRDGYDIHVLAVAGGEISPFIAGAGDQSQGQFSPDGKWVAYTSTESGRLEVYVQPFPATGAKWQVSVGGGEQPRWRRDGRELYYIAPDRNLMVVRFATPGSFDGETPRALFATTIPFGDINVSQAYDVSPNGEQFVIAASDPLLPQSPISVVVE